ncbi:MAG: GMC family oxidoreductase [Actinomycetota bacterium]
MNSAEVPRAFIDARTADDGSELVCDVCVVGSGAAGTTLALRLLERGRSVLLLESGGGLPDPETSSLNDIETTGLPVGPDTRQRFLGGTTNSWGGRCAMLEETDFGQRPWLGVPSWPIDRAQLLPYYAEGCRLLGVPDMTTVTVDRFQQSRGFLVRTPDLETVRLFLPRKPRRFRDLLEPAVRSGRGLEACLFANVTRLVPGAGGTGIEYLEVRTVSGRAFRVRPKAVVLACGGLENARRLLVSGGDGRSAIGAGRAVGRYYMDHPTGVAGMVRVDRDTARLPHSAYWDFRLGRFQLGIRLSPERQLREGLLGGYVRFHAIRANEGRATSVIRQVYWDRRALFRNPKLLADLVLGVPDTVAFARFKAFNRGPIQGAAIYNFTEQAPRPENRVTLSQRLDLFGNPLTRLEWSIGELDRRSLRALHAALDEDFRRRGFGRVESPLISGEDEQWPISTDANHHLGTTRMGDDPSTSVVDRDCRLHGLDNLYVVGSSVFATSGYANPTLTIVALALRLADHLAAR